MGIRDPTPFVPTGYPSGGVVFCTCPFVKGVCCKGPLYVSTVLVFYVLLQVLVPFVEYLGCSGSRDRGFFLL